MANQIVNTVIRYRSGNSTDWASSNIVLQQGEPGYELDTHKIKIGDGVTAYNDLPYVAGDGDLSLLEQHLKDFNNPHQVTKAQVGLSNVDNTSDVNKPVSTAQAAAISQVEAIANDAQSAITTHVANTSNPHQVTKAQVGLGNVDNIADASQQVHGQRQVSSDLNSYTDSGWYYGVSGNSCANKPSNVDTFTLVVYKLSSTLCTQVLFDPANISGNTLYVRSLNNTTWGSWSPYATISDIPTNISSLNNDAGYIKNQSGAFSYDNLSNNPIPDPTSSDAGKVVAVNINGNGFDLVEPASGGSDVVANPEDQATDELTKLGVDGITYSIPSTLMTVSDVNDPTATEIKTIAFGGDKYRFPSGGGTGMPSGGTAGQVLTKVDDTDYNAEWADLDEVPIDTQDIAIVRELGTVDGADTVKMPDGSYKSIKEAILALAYPVGTIYASVNNTSPASFLGGTWEALTTDATEYKWKRTA